MLRSLRPRSLILVFTDLAASGIPEPLNAQKWNANSRMQVFGPSKRNRNRDG
jgi:hypothetical protein